MNPEPTLNHPHCVRGLKAPPSVDGLRPLRGADGAAPKDYRR